MLSKWIDGKVKKYRNLAEGFRFFDSNLWLGPPEGFPLAQGMTIDELKKIMDESFITGGLISHWWGKTLSAQAGNDALIKASSSFLDKMYSIWTGLPLYPNDEDHLPGKGKPQDSLRGVRVFPKSHNYPLTKWVTGTLIDWLINHNIPLFIWHTELDWLQVHDIAKNYPELTVIIETQTKKIIYHARVIFPLMRECSNVLVETSNFVGQGYIEYAVKEFGAERLIFGSFLPINDPMVSIGMIIDSDITERDKRLIASENLLRIINGVLP